MLKIYQSNKINFLLKKICKKIYIKKKKKILINEIFLIENKYVQKWLELYIANKKKINFNIKFILLFRFLNNFFKKNNIKKNKKLIIFEKKYLQWIIILIIYNTYDCSFLKKYGIQYKNFEFCSHIANIFIQYIYFQPHLIYEWENNKKSKKKEKKTYQWQKKLWNLIIKKIKMLKCNNFTEIISNFIKKIEKKKKLKKIPKKIFILSNQNINILMYFILFSIKHITKIYLFEFNPLDRKKNKTKKIINYFQKKFQYIKNPIKENIKIKKKYFFYKNNKKKILSYLKNDILKKKIYKINSKKKININDNSISINQCKSYIHEVQIVNNYIHKTLETNKKIKLDDILITASNIDIYIPYIQKIFNFSQNKNLLIKKTGKEEEKKKEILLTIKDLLNIKNNYFKPFWILSLLNIKILRKKFSIKNRDIKTLGKLISHLNIAFGFNKKHYKEFSIPDLKTYSWEYAIKRITSGFIFNNKNTIYNNIYTYNISNDKKNILLGNFINFIKQLNKLRKKIYKKKKIEKWINIISIIIKNFFYIEKKDKKFFFLLKNIWKKNIFYGIKINFLKKISIEFFINEFFKNHSLLYKKNQFLSGNIKLINLNKINLIPFKVICILGCTQEKISLFNNQDILNLIEKKNKNNENIFLKTIFLTKKYLFLSYIKNNYIQNKYYPSKFILDIIFYIKNNFYYFKKKEKKKIQKKNFLNKIYKKNKNNIINSLFSKEKKKIIKTKKNQKKYKKINITIQKKIKIKKLINFWKNPIEYFFKNTLKVNIKNYEENMFIEDEYFSIKPLNKYKINSLILKNMLLNKKTDYHIKEFQLKNKLPQEKIAKILWYEKIKKINILSNQIKKIRKFPKNIHIYYKFKKYYLSGKIKEVNKLNLIQWNVNKIKFKDIITTWIQHIIYCAFEKPKKSILLSTNNKKIEFLSIKKKIAKKYLKKYIQGFIDGHKKPILILNSGIHWLHTIFLKKENVLKINKYNLNLAKKNFLKIWNGSNFFLGEKKNIFIKKIIPILNKNLIKKICNSCKYWILPIFKNTNIKKYHLQ
ncbi:exodeoxyribonuclease V subunit gamma [Buchnera aphidicola]|uniref:Exodeoxyribonuclease V, g chain n=1 Tax=Buchnera aphidicola subsp. Cinara cedri (strain Cc) TaxID=372461 RepID=Q057F6_BUCCC|nr:exodeoxyribonuclease V subunit gamma [Buchnera aphidicola]ABJ90743.1 exodeoxyribonuclease V, g chain [Buchnera aphidicola BCc]